MPAGPRPSIAHRALAAVLLLVLTALLSLQAGVVPAVAGVAAILALGPLLARRRARHLPTI